MRPPPPPPPAGSVAASRRPPIHPVSQYRCARRNRGSACCLRAGKSTRERAGGGGLASGGTTLNETLRRREGLIFARMQYPLYAAGALGSNYRQRACTRPVPESTKENAHQHATKDFPSTALFALKGLEITLSAEGALPNHTHTHTATGVRQLLLILMKPTPFQRNISQTAPTSTFPPIVIFKKKKSTRN